MTKEKQIKYLKDFSSNLDKWLETEKLQGLNSDEKEKKIREVEDLLSSKWGVVEEVFKSLNVNYKGDLSHRRFKGIKNPEGDLFVDGFIGMNHYSDKITNLEKLKASCLGAIEKIKTELLVRTDVLPGINLLLSILNSFPDVIAKWKHRRQGKDAMEIGDEYDIHDFLYTMLKGAFPTLQYENPTRKTGLTSNVVDFTIKDLGLFIEVKYIENQQHTKRIQRECKEDMVSYGKQDACNKIVFFIYDPKKFIDNKYAFSDGLGKKFSDGRKSVEIITLIIN